MKFLTYFSNSHIKCCFSVESDWVGGWGHFRRRRRGGRLLLVVWMMEARHQHHATLKRPLRPGT